MSFFYEIWLLIVKAAPYVLFGFLAAGLMHTFIPQSRIVSLIGKRNWKSVFTASICGIPLPLCSCSVLPMAATLRKKGASRGGTTSFLISTPETGIDSIALTYGLMDLTMAVLRPIAAFVTAFSAGLVVNRWGDMEEKDSVEDVEKNPIDSNCCDTSCSNENEIENQGQADAMSLAPETPWWKQTGRYAFIDLPNDLAHWFVVGFLLSGLISLWIPDLVFQSWVGQGFTSLLVMLAVSMPMYICASASTPVAAMMIAKGLSPGAALVLLLAGPATNVSTLPVLLKVLGRRATLLYLLSIIVITLAIGNFVNLYYAVNETSPQMSISNVEEEQIGIVGTLAGLLLLLMFAKAMWKRPAPAEMQQAGDAIAKYTGIRFSWKFIFVLLGLVILFSLLQLCVLIVGPGEIGLIQRFGKPVANDLREGIYFHWPPPISQTRVVRVQEIRTVEIGFRMQNGMVSTENNGDIVDSLFLTGDENMLDVSIQGDYQVNDADDFVFSVADPHRIVKNAIMASLTETLASMRIDTAYTTARREIESETLQRSRQKLSSSIPGIVELMNVRLVSVHAPSEVHQAFRDVASAEEDRLRQKNEALVDREKKVHLVQGEAAQRIENASAIHFRRVQNAMGESDAFANVAEVETIWPEETRMRMKHESIEQNLYFVSKTVVPASGEQPFFDLWLLDSGIPESKK